MNSAAASPVRVLVWSALPELDTCLRARPRPGADASAVEFRTVLEPGGVERHPSTRLLILGADLPARYTVDAVRNARKQMRQVSVVWVGAREDIANIPAVSKLVDATLILPEDGGVLADLMEEALQESPRKVMGLALARRAAPALLALALCVGLWHGITRVFQIPTYLLPAPTAVGAELVRGWADYLGHAGITAAEALTGFLIGNSFGFVVAVFLHRLSWLRRLTIPAFVALQAIPIVAIAPLLIVWFGSGLASKVAMASLICFFPMVVNTLQAFAAVDRDARDLFQLYRADFRSTVSMLLVPASAPALIAALRISAGLAVVGAIVAELTGADRGLGFVLLNASYRLQTERLFVAIVLAGALGTAFFHFPTLLWPRRRGLA